MSNGQPTTRLARDRRAQALFVDALTLTPTERPAFLDAVCAGDAPLRAAVEELLQLDAASVPALEPLSARSFAGADALLTETLSGERSYRLVSELGQGGFGSVFVAERADGEFRQRVAIKFLRPSVAVSAEAAQRFRAERQILADLEHPNITRLLDGGTAQSGQPFLVMELVAGEPLDRHALRLPVRERLRLFAIVCRAVHFAHQRRIVHRDLKPSNILVDSHGVPKLLDFGIAKLLDPDPTLGVHPETVAGRAPLTLLYASPEQVRGLPVSPASDVYALGVILYQLLTGSVPYGASMSTPLELQHAICELEPSRPSALVRRTMQARPTRQDGSSGLNRDLDAIALRALRKEPEQRYESALALAEDVERYLRGLTVTALPGTALYRARKLLRRRGALVTMAVAGILAAALASTFTYRLARPPSLLPRGAIGRIAVLPVRNDTGSPAQSWVRLGLAQVATQLLDEAEHVEAVPVGDVTRAMHDLEIADDRPLAPAAMTRLRRALGVDFLVRASVAGSQAGGYRLLYDLSTREGIAARRQLAGVDLPTLAGEMARRLALRLDSTAHVPDVADRLSEDPLANTLYAMGTSELSQRGGKYAQYFFRVALLRVPDFGWARLKLAGSLVRLAQWQEADATMAATLATARAVHDSRLEGETLVMLGTAASDRGNIDAALRWDREALAVLTRAEDRKGRADVLNNLGTLALQRGDLDQAESLLRQSLALIEQIHEPQWMATRLNNLALVASRRGNRARAQEMWNQTLAQARDSGNRSQQLTALTNLGKEALDAADMVTARRLDQQALDLSRESGDRGSEATALVNLGAVAQRSGDMATAERLTEQAAEASRAAADPRLQGFALANLSFLRTERGEAAAAIAAGKAACALGERVQDVTLRQLAEVNLAYAEVLAGELAAAERDLAAAEKLDAHEAAVLRVRGLYEYERGHLTAALAAMEEGKRVAGPIWQPEHESLLATFRAAVAQGRRLPLPEHYRRVKGL